MNDGPRVSLLMAAYNNVAYIKAAIDSVKRQTYDNWELCVQDDGSTDGTYELACTLATGDQRIKVETNGRNLGYNATLIEVAKRATGELWGHFDSDDMLERYAIEEMVRAFAQRPDVALIYSDFAQIAQRGKVDDYTIESYSLSRDFNPQELYHHGWRHFGMYRAKAYREVQGYNPKLTNVPGCGDGDLFMQIVEQHPAHHLPKTLYYYRNHQTNISRSIQKCEVCPANPDCNYIRVWAKAANRDQRTLQPLPKDQ
jgi:glycosyltransferase involved in cell wall biosynthesis